MARLIPLALALAGIALPAARPATAAPIWPNTPLARVEALALLQSLNAALLSNDSATLTLDRWCAGHHLAPPGTTIVADRLRDQDKPATPEIRAALNVDPAEPIRYRHVRLACGGHVLSEADNWYVPARLTPAMNAALDTTDIAFGRAVQPLHFRRRTLSARLLWSPLPEGWDGGAPVPAMPGDRLAIPDRLIEHRAILATPDGVPFSEVVETYTGEVLAFPPPAFARP
ncbi:hypothetical protein GCM10009087_03400 [Sphingomonas oligophenolica]|uniref:Chorismate lyase n=1 Tax=Sphingomonas oligophenolica TaxID=301154 RepID=A0ABU9Y0M0_9SPHN